MKSNLSYESWRSGALRGALPRGSGGARGSTGTCTFLGKPQTRYLTSPCLAHRTWMEGRSEGSHVSFLACYMEPGACYHQYVLTPVKTMSLRKPPYSHTLVLLLMTSPVKIAKFTLTERKTNILSSSPAHIQPRATPERCRRDAPVCLNGTLSKALPSSDPPPSPPSAASRPSSPAYSP